MLGDTHSACDQNAQGNTVAIHYSNGLRRAGTVLAALALR